jgi:hypothetical protein
MIFTAVTETTVRGEAVGCQKANVRSKRVN